MMQLFLQKHPVGTEVHQSVVILKYKSLFLYNITMKQLYYSEYKYTYYLSSVYHSPTLSGDTYNREDSVKRV